MPNANMFNGQNGTERKRILFLELVDKVFS